MFLKNLLVYVFIAIVKEHTEYLKNISILQVDPIKALILFTEIWSTQ